MQILQPPAPPRGRGLFSFKPYFPLMIVTTIIWGAAFPITKPGLLDVPPATFAVARFGISLGVLLPFLFGLRKGWHLPPQAWGRVALAGFLGFSFAQLGQNWGLTLSPASDIAILASTEPLCIAVMAAFFLKERPGQAVWAGLAISLVGVLVVVGVNPLNLLNPSGGADGKGDYRVLGDLTFLTGMLGFAIYNILTRSLTQRYNGLELTSGALIFGFLGLVPFSAFEIMNNKAPQFTQAAWVGILYSALLVTAFGFLALSWSIKKVPVARVALLFYIQPVSGVLISWFGGEKLTLNFGIGAAIILTGLFVAEYFSAPS